MHAYKKYKLYLLLWIQDNIDKTYQNSWHIEDPMRYHIHKYNVSGYILKYA